MRNIRRKLVLLIVMMFLSWNVFSQNVTPKKDSLINNDSIVRIHKDVAIKITKDLLYLDAVKQENVLLKEDTFILSSQNKFKDSLIGNKNKQIDLYKGITAGYEAKEGIYTQQIQTLSKQNKWLKFQRTTLGVILVATISFFAFKL